MLSFVGPFARTVRADVLQIKARPFIEAARLMGVPEREVVMRHVLPNIVSPILIQAGMRISIAILLASGLSFLGLGVVPPTPDWGLMIAEGRGFISMAPWMAGMSNAALMVENFTLRRGGVAVLDNVTLSLPAGQTLALIGESGAGKSTLAFAAMGLARPPEVTLEGRLEPPRVLRRPWVVSQAGMACSES